MKKEINVVGAVLVKENKILCCQRGPGRSLAYLWEFPGGKIEVGETKIDALARELKEELKISVSIEKNEFAFCRFDYDFGVVHLTTFICHLIDGEPELTEHITIKWLKPKDIGELDWAPADLPTVIKIQKSLKMDGEILYE